MFSIFKQPRICAKKIGCLNSSHFLLLRSVRGNSENKSGMRYLQNIKTQTLLALAAQPQLTIKIAATLKQLGFIEQLG